MHTTFSINLHVFVNLRFSKGVKINELDMYIIMEWIGGAAVSPISAMAGHFHSNVVIHSSAIQGLRHVLLALSKIKSKKNQEKI